MYLHLGGDTVIRKDEIIGIFDLENSTVSPRAREFLTEAEKNGRIVNVSSELPKSFVVCQENDTIKVYICQLLPVTLIRRAAQRFREGERKE